VHLARNADAARFGQAFQPSRNVHPIPIDLLLVNDDVAKIDTDAELHPPGWCQIGIFRFKSGLNSYSTLDRVHHAVELGQYAVAGGVDETAVVLLDELTDDPPIRGQGAKRRLLIVSHKAAVAVDVGAQDRGEFAFHPYL
jgi:hypothetical protein